MKVAIGCDHAGFEYKEKLKQWLIDNNYECEDVGTFSPDAVDYPIYAKAVCEKVISRDVDYGILFCGTGIGMAITANRYKGIRASNVSDTYSAKMTRAHNNSNVLTLGERVIGVGLAKEIVDVWLNTEFEGGRHQKRIDMLDK